MPVPMIISVVGRKPRMSAVKLSRDDSSQMITTYGLSFDIPCDADLEKVHSQDKTVHETAMTDCSTLMLQPTIL